jgi:transcription initiation factor IIE alpha subunit
LKKLKSICLLIDTHFDEITHQEPGGFGEVLQVHKEIIMISINFIAYACNGCMLRFAVEAACEDQEDIKCPKCLKRDQVEEILPGRMLF